MAECTAPKFLRSPPTPHPIPTTKQPTVGSMGLLHDQKDLQSGRVTDSTNIFFSTSSLCHSHFTTATCQSIPSTLSPPPLLCNKTQTPQSMYLLSEKEKKRKDRERKTAQRKSSVHYTTVTSILTASARSSMPSALSPPPLQSSEKQKMGSMYLLPE